MNSTRSSSQNILARSQLVHLEVCRLGAEAQTCTDLDRLAAIWAEMDVLHTSMIDLRREQLAAEIERTSSKSKRRWWRRG